VSAHYIRPAFNCPEADSDTSVITGTVPHGDHEHVAGALADTITDA